MIACPACLRPVTKKVFVEMWDYGVGVYDRYTCLPCDRAYTDRWRALPWWKALFASPNRTLPNPDHVEIATDLGGEYRPWLGVPLPESTK